MTMMMMNDIRYRGSPPNAKNGTRKNTVLREIALCEVTIM